MNINRAAIESFLTSAIVFLGGLIALDASGVVSIPANVLAWTTIILSVARTAAAALNPNQKAYGVGAAPKGKHAP